MMPEILMPDITEIKQVFVFNEKLQTLKTYKKGDISRMCGVKTPLLE